jgi:hypothetical protein
VSWSRRSRRRTRAGSRGVSFDTRRAVAPTAPHGLPLPRFRDYLEPMVEFFREHEHDPDPIIG